MRIRWCVIEGHIESLTADAVVQGWVRDSTRAAPCHVELMHDGQALAAAVANEFRADLLRTGHGHGHYGFAARLRRHVTPGLMTVMMHLPEQGISAPMRLEVPELQPSRPVPVEALLAEVSGWTAADLLARPDCLNMGANHARLGTARFVDAVFRFVFGRWPSKAEVSMNMDSLESGRVSPEAVLVDYLRSRERGDMAPRLPSPFAPDFPFLLLTGH